MTLLVIYDWIPVIMGLCHTIQSLVVLVLGLSGFLNVSFCVYISSLNQMLWWVIFAFCIGRVCQLLHILHLLLKSKIDLKKWILLEQLLSCKKNSYCLVRKDVVWLICTFMLPGAGSFLVVKCMRNITLLELYLLNFA